jgi:hypothetical protein
MKKSLVQQTKEAAFPDLGPSDQQEMNSLSNEYKSESEDEPEECKMEQELPWPQFEAPFEPILDFSPAPEDSRQPGDNFSAYIKQTNESLTSPMPSSLPVDEPFSYPSLKTDQDSYPAVRRVRSFPEEFYTQNDRGGYWNQMRTCFDPKDFDPVKLPSKRPLPPDQDSDFSSKYFRTKEETGNIRQQQHQQQIQQQQQQQQQQLLLQQQQHFVIPKDEPCEVKTEQQDSGFRQSSNGWPVFDIANSPDNDNSGNYWLQTKEESAIIECSNEVFLY